jgi:hypothetical protein
MNEFLMTTYTISLPIILGYIVWLLQNQKKDRDANSRGTMLLLREALIAIHDEYIELGYIPSDVYGRFCDLYEAYHALGGNGMIEKMKEEIDKLPLKD